MSIVIVNILQNWLENNYAIPAKPNFHIKKNICFARGFEVVNNNNNKNNEDASMYP